MLHCKHIGVFLSLGVISTSLAACANSPFAKNWEQNLAADPKLQDNPVILGAKEVNSQNQPKTKLPADFPSSIPIYPNAQLQKVTPQSDRTGQLSASWLSSDPSNFIANFYSQKLRENNWQVSQSTDESGVLLAQRDSQRVKVTIKPQPVTKAAPNQPQTATLVQIDYIPQTASNSNIETAKNTQPGDSDFIGPVQPTVAQPENTPQAASNPQEYNDLEQVAPQLKQYIEDLSALGILSADANGNKSNSSGISNLQPNENITRRQYAWWLVAANNAIYANSPAKQIREAGESAKPAFSDVPSTDPDFAQIQGLAEAGLIPSTLSGDSTQVLFRPDAPLTREQMILWKLPLDIRQGLPPASLDAVKQTWGFQDAGKIDPKALRAVLADYQNGEQSNIRRVFGYTTLFQPKKPVTRAEAAGSLWYFGTEGEGISARDALKLQKQ